MDIKQAEEIKKCPFPIVRFNSNEDVHPLSIVVAKNGAFFKNKNQMYESLVKLEDKRFPFLLEAKESVITSLPKIDYNTYISILTFFKKVYQEHKSEANILLLLDKTLPFENQRYTLLVPKQDVSGTSVEYKIDNSSIPENLMLAGSVHSHPEFGAFQSGTDHSDEISFDGVHITIGGSLSKNPVFHTRFCFGNVVYKTERDMIETREEIPEVEIPKEWLDRVSSKSKIVYVHGSYPQGYHNYGSNYPNKYLETVSIYKLLLDPITVNKKDSKIIVPLHF